MSDISASWTGAAETAGAKGRVSLVGAGPGDPDLLTIKAARVIGQAEIVFADRLVGKGVMELISPPPRSSPSASPKASIPSRRTKSTPA